MGRTVFVDTSCWVGFFLARDQHHKSSVALLDRLALAGRQLVTSDYVLSETVTYLRGKAGFRLAADAWDALETGTGARLLEVDAAQRRKARSWLERFRHERFSLTDCVSFVLMDAFSIGQAATFDRDFRKAGFETLPDDE